MGWWRTPRATASMTILNKPDVGKDKYGVSSPGRDDDDTSSDAQPPVPTKVGPGGVYEIGTVLGSGSFSVVHVGTETDTGDEVAVKFEWLKATKGRKLLHEARLYEAMPGNPGIPKMLYSGTENQWNVMVLQRLGSSLDDVLSSAGGKMNPMVVLGIGEQLVALIECVHSYGIIHRDIKPHNFLTGMGEQRGRVYIMDFGLAKRYIDPESKKHIPMDRRPAITGTVRYTSINVHRGLEPSRRDDLTAIGYVLVHMLRGRLPWQGISGSTKKSRQKKIGQCKERVTLEELCRGLPGELVYFLTHCQSLGFTEEPDYGYLRKLMRDGVTREQKNINQTTEWAAWTIQGRRLWRRGVGWVDNDGLLPIEPEGHVRSRTREPIGRRDSENVPPSNRVVGDEPNGRLRSKTEDDLRRIKRRKADGETSRSERDKELLRERLEKLSGVARRNDDDFVKELKRHHTTGDPFLNRNEEPPYTPDMSTSRSESPRQPHHRERHTSKTGPGTSSGERTTLTKMASSMLNSVGRMARKATGNLGRRTRTTERDRQ